MKKRRLPLLICLCLMLTTVPMAAFASDGVSENPVKTVGGWVAANKLISGYGNSWFESFAMILMRFSQNFNETKFSYDFNQNDCGFKAVFADYHNDGNNYESYEMKSDYRTIPVSGSESKGLYICSFNRSDDMFMGYVKRLEGLNANTEYQFSITFKLATNVAAGGFGIGGDPSDSVYVKTGIMSKEPAIEKDLAGNFRFSNIDMGHQSQGGENANVVGNLAKPDGNDDNRFAFKEFSTVIKATADANGSVYLLIGTDSGFEGFTEYYIDDITVVYRK